MKTGRVAVVWYDDTVKLVAVDAKFSAGQWFVHKKHVPDWWIQMREATPAMVARITSGWCVTHAKLGYRAVHLTSLADAKACCRVLGHLKLKAVDDRVGLRVVRRALARLGVLAGKLDQRCGEAIEVAS